MKRGTDFSNKAHGKLRELIILCPLTFQRRPILGYKGSILWDGGSNW